MLLVPFFSPTTTTRAAPDLLNVAAASKTFRRAEFWSPGSASLLDVVNVLGRWETVDEWKDRTIFSVPESRDNSILNGATEERFRMAQKLGVVERVALLQNVKDLPFKNAALAKSLGLDVADFETLAINADAVNIVYDALAQSKASMLPPETISKRRARFFMDDGGIDELAFSLGLFQARFAVIISWFVYGKGNIAGLLVLLKVVSDVTGLGSDLYGTLLRNTEGLTVAFLTAGLMAVVGQRSDREEAQRFEELARSRKKEETREEA